MPILNIEMFSTQKKTLWHFYSLTLIFPRIISPIRVVREPSPLAFWLTALERVWQSSFVGPVECWRWPEPSLFAHMNYGSRRGVRQKSDIQPHWIAAHAHLKNEFTEDESTIISWDGSCYAGWCLFYVARCCWFCVARVSRVSITCA